MTAWGVEREPGLDGSTILFLPCVYFSAKSRNMEAAPSHTLEPPDPNGRQVGLPLANVGLCVCLSVCLFACLLACLFVWVFFRHLSRFEAFIDFWYAPRTSPTSKTPSSASKALRKPPQAYPAQTPKPRRSPKESSNTP